MADFVRYTVRESVDEIMLDRYIQRMRRAIATAPNYPREWYEAMAGSQNMLHLTAEELRELVAAYTKVAEQFRERYAERDERADLRPDGTLPVETLFFAYPVDQERS